MRRDWWHAMDDPGLFAAEDLAWQDKVPFFEAVAEWITPGTKTLLDVGCGSGVGLRVWRRRVPVVIGLDASLNCATSARMRNPDAVVICADFQDTCDLTFDVDTVVCTAWLKHFPVSSWRAKIHALSEWATERLILQIQLGPVETDGDDPDYWHSSAPRPIVEQMIHDAGLNIVGWDDYEPTEPVFVLEHK